ncbi:MAG: hypothetical protein IIV40_01745 [Oscillospiraceae bacterium]|nr:hypothetical protein [Oscillospiraceae bacterium]
MADMKKILLKRKNLELKCKDEVARAEIPVKVTGTGAVICPCENKKDYSYTNVTKFTMACKPVECHGFVTFGTLSEPPSVTADWKNGDDITEAQSGETWEFSVFGHNNKSSIIWQKKETEA